MFEAIQAALAKGDATAAIAAARDLVAKQPGNARALHLLGVALRLSGDLEGAARSLDRAIALAPDNAQLHLARATLDLPKHDAETASAALDPAVAQESHALNAYVLRGHNALSQGDRGTAESQLKLAEQVNPDHPQVLALKGNVALAFGDPKDALLPLTRAVQFAPTDDFVLSCLGVAFLATGSPAFAEQSLRRALEQQPESRRVRWALIEALQQQEQFAAALAEVDQQLRDQPNDPNALALRGSLQLALGERDHALASYRSLLTASERPGDVLGAVLSALLRADMGDAARQLFDEQLADRPGDDLIWQVGLLLEPPQPEARQQYAARWQAQCPDSVNALLAQADAAERLNELESAEAFADRILDTHSGNSLAHFIKLRAELRSRPSAALERAERLAGSAPNVQARRACLVWRGFAFDALDRTRDAARSWIEARGLPGPARPLPNPTPEVGETVPHDDGVPPRLLWGPPGSPVRQVTGMVRGVEGFFLLDDRFGLHPRQDGLGPDRDDAVFASQQDWRRLAERLQIDVTHALDWLLHFDARHAARLPDARLLAVLADPRDLLLNWLSFGSPQEYLFPGLAEAGQWLALALQPLAQRLEAGASGDLVIRHESLQSDPEGCSRAIAEFCGLEGRVDSARLERAGVGLGGLPMSLRAGRWQAYGEVLVEGFAPLHGIVARLGYPSH